MMTGVTAMTVVPYFHVGILVSDMAEAIERFSDVLGLTFAEPITVHVPELDEGGDLASWDVHLTYSRQGPPHIELIQADGTGAYGLHHGIGLHHIGAWAEGVNDKIASLEELQVTSEAVFRSGDDVLGAFFKPSDLLGVRYEISPLSIKDNWAAWLRGEKPFM
jgi:catechol 2,3-dioxygenase-like lactoylglutathione lyase family enzyme